MTLPMSMIDDADDLFAAAPLDDGTWKLYEWDTVEIRWAQIAHVASFDEAIETMKYLKEAPIEYVPT